MRQLGCCVLGGDACECDGVCTAGKRGIVICRL